MNAVLKQVLSQLSGSLPVSGFGIESMAWLTEPNSLPLWSRRLHRSTVGGHRSITDGKWHNYDIELADYLWSLWGGLHPKAPWFDKMVRGRQFLACCVVACCVASVYQRLGDWNGKLLDTIVVNGDKYYRDSVERSERWDHNLQLKDLNANCYFDSLQFLVNSELVANGRLYTEVTCTVMNLSEALNFFFAHYQNGILLCQKRALAFGFSSAFEGGYYLFDCQEWDKPIFPPNMGASYLLRTKHLQLLLYCMIVALNVRQRNIKFELYKVNIVRLPNVAKAVEEK